MKYIIFTYKGEGLAVAYHLMREGADVTVGMVEDPKELGIGDDTEENIFKTARHSLYSGMLDVVPAKYLIKAMAKLPNKDNYWVHVDFNCLFRYAKQIRDMGFKYGNFPTKEDYSLESDRAKAKELVEKYYPSVQIGEFKEFSKIEEAIEFLEETDEVWVLKGSNESAKTRAPRTKNARWGATLLTDSLKKDKAEYENGGFILERRIHDMHELTPQMYLWNGKPIMTNVNIELKEVGAGNEGTQTGCGGDLVIQTNIEDEINKISFPQAIIDQYKGDVGLRLLDISLYYKDGQYFFGEFCPNRFGYDSNFTEMEMSGDRLQDYFEKIREGKNPLIKKFGAATRIHSLGDTDNVPKDFAESGLRFQFDPDYEKHIWLYDVTKDYDTESLVTTGFSWDLGVFTGASDDLQKAVELAYEAAEHLYIEKSMKRPMEDFLSEGYDGSIMRRYRALDGKAFNVAKE